jgi:poly(hydroxyalkanoate) depolymerase family esterase
MLRLLRSLLKKSGVPYLRRRRKEGGSRFLEARFKDSHASKKMGVRRELDYRLFLPTGSSRRDGMPLMVMLHGCKQDPLGFAHSTRMNILAEQYRCAVLYPAQNQRANPLHCWNWFESDSLMGQGEGALIARLIAQVAQRRPIDPCRVYVVGMSAGGAMACLLAVRHRQLFAACAIHSGVMFGAARSSAQALAVMRSGPSPASLEAARRLVFEVGESAITVPTLVIHGDHDMVVNPVNADRIIEQCTTCIEKRIDPSAGPVLVSDEYVSNAAGYAYRQQDSTQQGQLVLRKILVEGLGHAWSGGDANYEFNDANGPDASRFILDFVMQYQRKLHPIVARMSIDA